MFLLAVECSGVFSESTAALLNWLVTAQECYILMQALLVALLLWHYFCTLWNTFLLQWNKCGFMIRTRVLGLRSSKSSSKMAAMSIWMIVLGVITLACHSHLIHWPIVVFLKTVSSCRHKKIWKCYFKETERKIERSPDCICATITQRHCTIASGQIQASFNGMRVWYVKEDRLDFCLQREARKVQQWHILTTQ